MHIIPVVNEQNIYSVGKLAQEIWREHYPPIIGKAQVDYMLNQWQSPTAIAEQIKNGFLYYLIQDPGKTNIGYFAVTLKPNELVLSKIYLIHNQRSKGYGKKVVAYVAQLAKAKGLSKITLAVNKHNVNSIQAYQRMGFVICDSMVTDIGGGFVMDDYKMEMLVNKK